MRSLLPLFLLIGTSCYPQGYTSYFTGDVSDVNTPTSFGTVLMGGATESDDAMRWFLNKAPNGDIVVLRSSGSDGYNNYFFSELGVTVNSVETLVITSQAGATNSYVLQQVANAEAIWFAGGDQFNYVSFFKDNAMEAALNNFINVKQGVIGGTSAGMAILGNHYFDAANGTVTSVMALGNPYHTNVSLGNNDFLAIPYLQNVITDTHYDNPDRRGRQVSFMARMATDQGMHPFGIASEEYTAVCIDNDGKAYVFGDHPIEQDFAYFIFANCVTTFGPERCTSGQSLDWNRSGEALQVYKVPGTNMGVNYLDLNDWETGVGGSWERWYVTNGTLMTAPNINPNCGAILDVEDFDEETIQLSPNPFENDLVVKLKSDAAIEVFDILGKKVFQQKDISETTIDTRDWSRGVYLIRITNVDNQLTIKKLIKR
ncbi:T9SS type A sorting domain-containing protein [Sungkyunkwania multivorans]|uniref:T9SS type A sorting domain-containing protein n=1 Tax=Sungkyunkwania multivorans TaxID=1173618 RepID=A0ABW3CWY6_9FLAO